MPALLVRFTVRVLSLCTFMPALQLNSFSNGDDYAAENVEIFLLLLTPPLVTSWRTETSQDDKDSEAY
jgi:hypothetical protein